MAQTAESLRPTKPKSHSLPYWVEPTFTVLALGLFGLYTLWLVFFQSSGQFHNYLSPFFSPTESWGVKVLPAIWVLWSPLLFRATCYYYRKEIYRGFFHDPVSCSVPESRKYYFGETRFPFSWTNLHRWFWYVAVIVLVFLWIDAVQAFIFNGHFGIGLGSIIMLINVLLLTAYTFSCHAFRHLIGGGSQKFTCADGRPTTRFKVWNRVSAWNENHGTYAWISMFFVWFTDVYIRLLMNGVIHDVRFF